MELLILGMAIVLVPRVAGGILGFLTVTAAALAESGPVARLAALRAQVDEAIGQKCALQAEIAQLEGRLAAPACVFCGSEAGVDDPRCGSCGRPNARYLTVGTK